MLVIQTIKLLLAVGRGKLFLSERNNLPLQLAIYQKLNRLSKPRIQPVNLIKYHDPSLSVLEIFCSQASIGK